jgi:anthranilate synthase component 1
MAVSAEAGLDLEPSLDRARELAREGNAIPVRMSFVDDCETPVSAFLKLRTDGPCFLLESAEQGRLGRYSFLGFRPRAILRWDEGVLSEWPGDASTGDEPQARHRAPDPYAAVSEYLGRHRLASVEDLPPFAGGAVGSSATTWSARLSPTGRAESRSAGASRHGADGDVLVVFDHMRHELTLMAYAFLDGGRRGCRLRAAAGAIAEVRAPPRPVPAPPPRDPPRPRPRSPPT